MVFESENRAFSEAHRDASDPVRAEGHGRSPVRFSAEARPSRASADGEEDPGLSRSGRARTGSSACSPPPLTDATTAILQAIRVQVVHFAGFVLEEIRSRRWASVTFQGARHEIAFRLEGEGADEAAARFLSGLDARNFTLRGHLLADVSLMAQERRPGFARIRLDALTVEEK